MAVFDMVLAATLNNQAETYKEEGRYADAEPLYKRVLAINEKALGPDHPSVALALHDLADLYTRPLTRSPGYRAITQQSGLPLQRTGPLRAYTASLYAPAGELPESDRPQPPVCGVGAGQSGLTLQKRGPLRRFRAALQAGT